MLDKRIVSTGAFCVRCPVRNARKLRWIRYSIHDCACIISTEASVSPSVIVQICLPNMQMRAITYAIRHVIMYAIAQEYKLGGGAIANGKKDAFSRIADGTTDAKSARGSDPKE
jgi:hypothetical protein